MKNNIQYFIFFSVLLFVLFHHNILCKLTVVQAKNAVYFDSIVALVKLEENERLILVFVKIGTCAKCIELPRNLIDNAEINIKNSNIKKIKRIAFVHCEREIEKIRYLKQSLWRGYGVLDDGSAKENFNIPNEVLIAIAKKNGKIYFFSDKSLPSPIEFLDLIKK
jgi:hypothetical protein